MAKTLKYSWTSAYSGSWVCPAGVYNIMVECWGGGGAGGGQNSITQDGGGGGGGGAYAKTNSINVRPGQSYSINVGAGGTGGTGNGGNGGDSSFGDATQILAKGGIGGQQSTGTPPEGGLGGASGSCIGDTKYSGGQGEKGRNQTVGQGGYGGSSAGTASNGYSGPQTWSTVTFPVGSEPSGAGIGGNGGTNTNVGNAPASGNGGGGGGSGSDGSGLTGGNGAAGKLYIYYEDNIVFNAMSNA